MAELADAQVSEACGGNPVEVQVLFRAPIVLRRPPSLWTGGPTATYFLLMDLQPHLTGSLIKARPLRDDDFECLYAVASDPLIWEQHPERLRYQRDVFQKYFDSGIASKGCLLLQDQQTQEVIGCSRFYGFSATKKEVKVGYTFLVRKCWGGRHNKELKHLMLTHAFGSVETVLFDVGRDNFRSRSALEKIGAKLASAHETCNAQEAMVMYSIHKGDFKGLI